MTHPRYNHSACTVYGRLICVSGGIYETSRRSVEVFDPDNGPRG